jgi:hypothetical protein
MLALRASIIIISCRGPRNPNLTEVEYKKKFAALLLFAEDQGTRNTLRC